MSWAGQRRALYLSGVGLVLIAALAALFFVYFYNPPSCFDGSENGDELGIDCGGSCQRLCAFEVTEPVVRWSRSFAVTPGNYSAVAYVENQNPKTAAEEALYTFQLLDEQGLLIAERAGTTFLLPNRVTPVFEANINTGNRIPARTFFEFTGDATWFRVDDRGSELVVRDRVLSKPDLRPRLDATLENTSTNEFRDVEVVAVIFGTDGNAVSASKTFIERLPKRASHDLVFTWPLPFPKRVESCKAPADVMLLLDVSGSMNDDGGVPPQPISDAKAAAAAFVERLDVLDRAGLVSFATNAALLSPLTVEHTRIKAEITRVIIDPVEERGFTNIGDAIIAADSELRSPRHNQAARPVLVLLTDGRANAPEDPGGEEHARARAAVAKKGGAFVYTIGLGEAVNGAFLRDIAGSEARTFFAATSDELDGIYREISASICERGPAVIDILPKTRDAFSLPPEVR